MSATGPRQLGDRSPSGRRLIPDHSATGLGQSWRVGVNQGLSTSPTLRFMFVAERSASGRRQVGDRSPIDHDMSPASLRLVLEIWRQLVWKPPLQNWRPVTHRSGIGRRSIGEQSARISYIAKFAVTQQCRSTYEYNFFTQTAAV